LLDLEWNAFPYEVNASAPGSGLRFDIDDSGEISVSYYFTLFGNTLGEIQTVPVSFLNYGNSNTIALDDFLELADSVLDQACVTSSETVERLWGAPRARA
jgi:hypothetical protein